MKSFTSIKSLHSAGDKMIKRLMGKPERHRLTNKKKIKSGTQN